METQVVEKAAIEYSCANQSERTNGLYDKSELEWAFEAGAEWQKEQMMKDAIPARVSFGQVVLQERPISTSVAKDGDKVKVIIVKEEE